jgi:HSP20 family protein
VQADRVLTRLDLRRPARAPAWPATGAGNLDREVPEVDLIPWQPGAGLLSRPQRLFERFFDDPWSLLGGPVLRRVPPVEVLERGDHVVIRAELAGIEPRDLDVRVEEDSVTIRGERRTEERGEEGGFFHSERQYGTFVRTVALPAPVDPARARARFRHGLLEVEAPRRDDDARRGRRVDVEEQ